LFQPCNVIGLHGDAFPLFSLQLKD